MVGATLSPPLLLPVGIGFEKDTAESITASESLAQRLVAGGHIELDHFFFFFFPSEINGFST